MNDYLEKLQEFSEKNELTKKKVNQMVKDSQFAIPHRLQDTAQVLLETKRITGKAYYKCRKLDFFGDVGEIAFE